MDCQEAVELQIAGLDRELAADEVSRLGEHLAECEACRGVRDRFRKQEAPGGESPGGESPKVEVAEREEVLKQALERMSGRRKRATSPEESAAATKLAAPPAADVPGYRILGVIGSGAMGTVYNARQVSMDRVVALKVLSSEMAEDREFTERFLREARVSGRLNHPNVVSVFDAGHEAGTYYLAMEYVDGRSVGDRLKGGEDYTEKEAVDICVQVARALEHAARHDLIHRDVKPDNILVTSDGVAKLCDLGLSKATTGDADITRAGVVVGTPFYISPEQAQGSTELDARVDIYALGCTLYHMLTGRVPFEGKTSAAVMMRHVTDPFPDPRDLVPGVSAEFVAILRRMVEKDRDKRYPSATDLRGALEALREGRAEEKAPPVAAKPAAAQKAKPRPRRSRGQAAARGKRPRAMAARSSAVKRGPSSRGRASAGATTFVVVAAIVLVGLIGAFVFFAERRGTSRAPRISWTRKRRSDRGAPSERRRKEMDEAGLTAVERKISSVTGRFEADPSKAESLLRELDKVMSGVNDPGLLARSDALRIRIRSVLNEEANEYVAEVLPRAREFADNRDYGRALKDGGPLDTKIAPAAAKSRLGEIRREFYAEARALLQKRIKEARDPVHEFVIVTHGMPKSIVDEAREQLGVKGEGKPGEGR